MENKTTVLIPLESNEVLMDQRRKTTKHVDPILSEIQEKTQKLWEDLKLQSQSSTKPTIEENTKFSGIKVKQDTDILHITDSDEHYFQTLPKKTVS